MTVRAGLAWGPEFELLSTILDDPDRAGAVVVGGPGAGKTTLIRAVLQDRGARTPLTLQCGAALADVAYGALSPFLADIEEIRGPVDVLGAVQRHLDALGPGQDGLPSAGSGSSAGSAHRPVIVVEDCQFLDAASAFVLAQLAQNGAAVLLATSIGLLGESGLNALVDTGLLATVRIPPLGAARTRAMCTLGGASPTAGAVRTILGMTGGSPLLIEAFVASAREQGIVVPDDEARAGRDAAAPWTLLRPGPSVDERLVSVVEAMHIELTDEQQEATTMLALAGRMPQSQLRVVAGDQRFDLAEAHVIHSTDDGMVELRAALYGEVLRAITPPGRSSDLLARWAAAGGTALRPPPARSVVWRIDNGLSVPDAERLAAGYEHLAARDLAAAWSLAAQPGERDDPRLGLLRAEVMLATDRTWTGRTDLVELADRSTDEGLLPEMLCVLAMDLVRSGEPASPAEALRQVWSDFLERAQHQGRPIPGLRRPLAEWLAALDLLDDPAELPHLMDRSAELLADPQSPPAPCCLAHWLRLQLLSRTGEVVAAAAEAALAYDLAMSSPRMTALMGGHALVHVAVARILAGDLDAAGQVLEEQRHSPVHRWHAEAGTVEGLQGILELSRGRLRHGARALRDAARDLEYADPAHLVPVVEALYALVTTPAEPLTPSGSLVDQLQGGGRRGSADLWLLALGVAGVVDGVRHPANPGEAAPWQRILDDSELERYPAIRREILLAAMAGRDPGDDDGDLLARLHQVCGHLDGRRSDSVRKASDPAIASDPVRLVQLADSLRAAGEPALAADVWARVVQFHHRANDLRRRGEALRHLQEVVQRLGGVPSRYVGAALELGALTEREREIVVLAHRGHTNAEIARILVVSPRTVEGHLYRAFTKLGISDRTELRGLSL